ncbi:hypothetical protein [Nocardia abscessus]|uniref:hypothetical protein n=1 Tax=Nocardia abscessus TaxID=120957 RepID=UPI002454E499|nr:hypothetical protein [Nocardia abscessus]
MPTGLAGRVLPAGRVGRRAALAAVVVLLCAVVLALAYANKARCAGAGGRVRRARLRFPRRPPPPRRPGPPSRLRPPLTQGQGTHATTG